MIARQMLLTELNYTIWANQRLLQDASELSEDELRRNLGASHASVIRTLRHIYDAERLTADSRWRGDAPTGSVF